MMSARAFSAFQIKHGFIAWLDRKFPTYLSAWDRGTRYCEAEDTHYGYVHEGPATLTIFKTGQSIELVQGQFFVVPGACAIEGGKGIIISREAYLGMLHIGMLEQEGRLKYIDGCTDTLLSSPPMSGDPCLNLLYLPPGIDQTAHTHPSDRIGIVLSGRGVVRHGPGLEPMDLRPGMIWVIHTDGLHKFQTPYGEHLRVLAYHPETDFGPTHESNPMLNRTIVEGVSANDPTLAHLRTK